MENFKMPVPVEWCNKRVLTTAQLAEYYGCDTNNIKKNFNANRDRFIEGKHYFRVEGADLHALKLQVTDGDAQKLQVTDGDAQSVLQISSMTRVLYLWTERGAARHAKMLSTDRAWDVFELLEDAYFNPQTTIVAPPAAKREPNPNRRAGQLKAACVYVLLLSSGIIKIGQSSDVRRRKTEIKRETGLSIEKVYRTNLMSREVARLIERLCHEIFSSSKTDGEFFCVEFQEACKAVDAFVKFSDTLANIEPDKFLVLASKDNVKLIADRN